MGEVIGLTMLIYTRYLANDWEALPADLALFEEVVSRIEGAAHYLNLSRLVRARLETRVGVRSALTQVVEVMNASTVNFALQHLPRYQMIAGDAHADLGDAENARLYFNEALKGGPHGSQQWLKSELLRRLGDLAALTEPELARAFYTDAVSTAHSQQALLFELRAALAISRFRNDDGKGVELRSICDRFEEEGDELTEAFAYLGEAPRREGARASARA